ncbi:MlaD family protein [Ottowia thiooxydans]|uniref:MlaD family protein n=1 Tax=Ottowia thiooxydans TaxID=219182 RepID=UPI0004075F87|nr:MlaD family protein [Ottowia thiooxydans]
MENKSHALAAGVFVLVVAALLVGLGMWLMRDVTSTDVYEMTTSDAVSGLQPQAAVRFKGVAIGKVTDISFDPEVRGNVLVRIAINHDSPVTKSTFATLAYQGVTGLSFVQLDDTGQSSEPPPSREGGPPRIPLKPGLLGQLQDSAAMLVEKFDQTVERVNQVLGPENQAALTAALNEVGAAAKSINQLAANTDKTIEAQFGRGGSNIPGLVKQATGSLKTMQEAAVKTGEAMGSLSAVAADIKPGVDTLVAPGGVLDRLSESASTVSGTTLPRIQGLTEDVSRTIRRLDRVANSLNDNPQSLLYGNGTVPPGPGEPGFAAPAGSSQP